MNITLLSVDVKTIPTAKGSYQTAEVAYKNNSFQGKVEGKKVMSFGATKEAFTTLSTAQPGSSFEVSVVKNAAGYNDWIKLTPAGAVAGAEQTSAATSGFATKPTANAAPKSNYETAEERAQRQVLIVRQSSVSSAVAMLTAGVKTPPSVEAVLDVAKQLEDYVFGKKSVGPTGFADVPDFDPKDFPTVE